MEQRSAALGDAHDEPRAAAYCQADERDAAALRARYLGVETRLQTGQQTDGVWASAVAEDLASGDEDTDRDGAPAVVVADEQW